jgi:two-component system, LuxR family, response regulator FixJ
MANRGKVYVIDDDEAMRDSLDFLLGSADFDVTLFELPQHFLDALPRRRLWMRALRRPHARH